MSETLGNIKIKPKFDKGGIMCDCENYDKENKNMKNKTTTIKAFIVHDRCTPPDGCCPYDSGIGYERCNKKCFNPCDPYIEKINLTEELIEEVGSSIFLIKKHAIKKLKTLKQKLSNEGKSI